MFFNRENDLFMLDIIGALQKQLADDRMREIRPAYRKMRRVIDSCETRLHFQTAFECIRVFKARFPYAKKFSDRLCEIWSEKNFQYYQKLENK